MNSLYSNYKSKEQVNFAKSQSNYLWYREKE